MFPLLFHTSLSLIKSILITISRRIKLLWKTRSIPGAVLKSYLQITSQRWVTFISTRSLSNCLNFWQLLYRDVWFEVNREENSITTTCLSRSYRTTIVRTNACCLNFYYHLFFVWFHFTSVWILSHIVLQVLLVIMCRNTALWFKWLRMSKYNVQLSLLHLQLPPFFPPLLLQ